MATKSLITISERLDEFLSEAQTETEKLVKEAQVQAAKRVAEAKAEADKMKLQVERGEALRKAIQDEENKAAQIAKDTMKNYSGKIKAMESSHQRNKHKAVELVLKAVLPA